MNKHIAVDIYEANWLGMNWSVKESFPANMTACFTDRCLCKDGYFFSHFQYACVYGELSLSFSPVVSFCLCLY